MNYRLPSSSGVLVGCATWVAPIHDAVVAAHHVVGGGFILVSFGLVVAIATGVVAILAKAMGPAIIHGGVVV